MIPNNKVIISVTLHAIAFQVILRNTLCIASDKKYIHNNIDLKTNNPTKIESFNYVLEKDYPVGKRLFGPISAVEVDDDDNLIIFHRGDHHWLSDTFNELDVYQPSREKPISQEAVVFIDAKEKKLTRAWGKDMFFLPHGLSLNFDKTHLWLTDVALHQVFKFPIEGPGKDKRPKITLGLPFEPGSDENHFCKPTSVADTGDFVFVADGYCNSRIVMFNYNGKYLGQFGQAANVYGLTPRQPTFKVPHKIVWAKESQKLCVADRENGRIMLFNFKAKIAHSDVQNLSRESGFLLNGAITMDFPILDPQFNGRVFSIDYSPHRGGMLVAISGMSESTLSSPKGFVYNLTTRKLISTFAPGGSPGFGMAHDVAFTNHLADSIYVVDTEPPNMWKFFRNIPHSEALRSSNSLEYSVLKPSTSNIKLYAFLIVLLVLVIYFVTKKSRNVPYGLPSNSFASLYGNASNLSLSLSRSRFRSRHPTNFLAALFSKRPHFGFDDRSKQNNEFSRLPMEEETDDDKSDSDVEEFNIAQSRNESIKINV